MYPVYGLQPPACGIEPDATTLPPTVSGFRRRSFVLTGWLPGWWPANTEKFFRKPGKSGKSGKILILAMKTQYFGIFLRIF